MKVKKLIEILSGFDPEADAVIHDGEYGDHWEIGGVHKTRKGLAKISPFDDDPYAPQRKTGGGNDGPTSD